MGQCASKNAAIPEQGYLNTLVHDGVLVEELRSVILPVVRHRLVGNLRLPVISNIFFYPWSIPAAATTPRHISPKITQYCSKE